jgi:hypothetical protein
MTFLAARRQDRVDAPCMFDGPINGERFRLYVEKMLVPVLRQATSQRRSIYRLKCSRAMRAASTRLRACNFCKILVM